MASLIEIDRSAWDKHWKIVTLANLMQSWEYGEVKRCTERWRVHRFLLQDDNMKPQGLLQVLCFSLPFVGGIARINQGPVFFSDSQWHSPSKEGAREVMAAILNTARQHRWWYLSIIPNFSAKDEVATTLKELGPCKASGGFCSSAIVSIDKSAEDIRSSFDSKWRSDLNKSEKMGLELEIPPTEDSLPYLIDNYRRMQQEKGFKGIPTKTLYQMVRQQGPTWNPRILFARHNGERVCGNMFIGHGDSFTYLIGWLPEAGRSLRANYFLFWNAVMLFKDLGYKFCDVGGLGPHTAEGVARFKRRLNGEECWLVGEYSYCIFPIPFK